MKPTLVRLLVLATLATSMSAFAATEKPKQKDAANTSAAKHQNGCPDSAEEKKQKKAKTNQKENQEENQEDENYARFLMGMYG